MSINKCLIYKSIPKGIPVAGKDIRVESIAFDGTLPPPKGGLLVRTSYVSYDPSIRGRMRSPEIKWAYPAFQVNDPVEAYLLARVLKSDSTAFTAGDLIRGLLPIQEYINVPAKKVTSLEKIDNPNNVSEYHFLGALGMPGLAAYSSFYAIGKPKRGQTIFISSAAGALGQITGQLAKREGLTVIGSVGSDEKLKFILTQLGFDGGFNYKNETAAEALPRLAPKGLDIYYDNVGGEQLEASLLSMKIKGRIIASGMISQYSKTESELYKVKTLMEIVTSQLTVQGFVWNAPDMGPKYAAEHRENVEKWLEDGSLEALVDVTKGIDNAAEGLVRMLDGRNFGKAILEVFGSLV